MLPIHRPHFASVDYETSRFVVATAGGIIGTGRTIENGEEIPRGMFDGRTLRALYRTHRIETFAFANELPELREACARKGVMLDESPASVSRQDVQEVAPLKKRARR